MFASERYEIITKLIDTHRSVTVSELCEKFGVSIETVRRDLAFLEKNRRLVRVHGGAVAMSNKNIEFTSLSSRSDDNVDKKRELSKYAMKYISEGDVIAIDAGSTAAEFAAILCDTFKKLTVITNSTDIIGIASQSSDFKLISPGGTYLPSEKLVHGYIAEENLSRLHTDKCFIFPSAISYKFGAMTNLEENVGVELKMIGISDKLYILADSSKFETTSPIKLLDLSECDAVITDSALDKRICELYRGNGINLVNS